VEDRLFGAALEKAMNGPGAAVFDDDGLKVFFCGTGSPLPSARRAQTCAAVIAGDRFFIVDLGSGSFETVQAAGLPADRLAGVFLTHFHSDHIGDLSEANLGSWVTARPAPLTVYGPRGVERVINGENEAFALDSDYRIAHHGKGVAPLRRHDVGHNIIGRRVGRHRVVVPVAVQIQRHHPALAIRADRLHLPGPQASIAVPDLGHLGPAQVPRDHDGMVLHHLGHPVPVPVRPLRPLEFPGRPAGQPRLQFRRPDPA
ncbi:MAG: MBL fold metallo-hydrolase, partial [Sphingomonadales bacterium]|nr:MBL fold metallo-hydrolase [Sphingomonadales bacterium]